MGLLVQAGFHITGDEREADVILVNTCAFIDAAKEESINTILELARWKEEGRCRGLIAAGCLAQRYPEELTAEMPEIDALIGTGMVGGIVGAVRDCLDGKRVCATAGPGFVPAAPLPRVRTTPVHTAYLKIAEGCDNRCGFCVIPSLRGRYRSRTPVSVVTEARELAASGVRELILVAQDTTRYGRDLGSGVTLAGLLDQLTPVNELEWIRLLYCYPTGISEALIEMMATRRSLCRYLDIPMQHASDRVLRAMARPTRQADLRRLVDRLRTAIDGVALRSTFMLGFPGETERDVDELVAFLRAVRLERAGFFTFSPQAGTRAAALPAQVPEQVKKARLNRVAKVQQEITQSRHRALVGTERTVMVDGFYRDGYVGRTEADAPGVDGRVFLRSRYPAVPGELVRVRVTGLRGAYDLNGHILEE